jgi:hypothetical protein
MIKEQEKIGFSLIEFDEVIHGNNYTLLEEKILIDRGSGDGDALFIKIQRKFDSKIFYTIINSVGDLSKYDSLLWAKDKTVKELIEELELELNDKKFEFSEYVSETFYLIKDINGCVNSLSVYFDTPIDCIFDCFDNDEDKIKLEISKKELYPDQIFEMGEWEP